MKAAILILGFIAGFAAAAETGAELFQKAVTAERAAGNLEEAIKLYQRVAVQYASDRALAAKALLQEARCYEKLGQTKALKLYEQVARDYKDQREPATMANTRIAALRHREPSSPVPVSMTQRRIELSGPGAAGNFVLLQTDGQRRIFVDNSSGALMMGDLAGNAGRVVYQPPKGGSLTNASIISRDFSLILMHVHRPDGSNTFAAIRSDGTGYKEMPVNLRANWGCGPEISWDNRFVLFCQTRVDGPPEVWKFSVADGGLRKLGKAEAGYIFSPDGQLLAFNDETGRGLVMPSDGGEPHVISEAADGFRMIDWTGDGRYLIAASNASGSDALYLLPMKAGRRAGNAVFVRYGSFGFGRTLSGGRLVYDSSPSRGAFTHWIGKLDGEGHVLGWQQLTLTSSGASFPSWSPDSKQIAYVARDAAAGQYATGVLRLRNIESGEERELYKGALAGNCRWLATRPNILCTNASGVNAWEALSVSTETGHAEPLGAMPVGTAGAGLFVTRDDRALYGATPQGLMRWEIGSAQWNKVYDGPVLPRDQFLIIASPDERWITRYEDRQILIRPLQGGDWRPLIQLGSNNQAAFTADGNWLFYHRNVSGKSGLFRVATSGGKEERLGDFPSPIQRGNMWISPDARKVITSTLNPDEIWMLENFEPRP